MDELGLNVPVLVAQLLNFFILLVLLLMFLYRPILDMLYRRAQRIREGRAAAKLQNQNIVMAQDANQFNDIHYLVM